MTDQFERVDLEAELLAHLGHGVDVAGATCTEVEVLTDDDRPGVQRLDKDLLHEHVRGVAARSSSKEIRYTQSMPCASISSSFWSSVVSSFGAFSGRTTWAGWPSKVTTAERTPSRSAAARTCRKTSW